jgi:hypothetical protein
MEVDDANDGDTTHDDDRATTTGDGQQIQQLEQLAQDVIHNHAENLIDADRVANLNGDNESSSDTCTDSDSDTDGDSLYSDESDMGPEDGEELEGFGTCDGYGSL